MIQLLYIVVLLQAVILAALAPESWRDIGFSVIILFGLVTLAKYQTIHERLTQVLCNRKATICIVIAFAIVSSSLIFG